MPSAKYVVAPGQGISMPDGTRLEEGDKVPASVAKQKWLRDKRVIVPVEKGGK